MPILVTCSACALSFRAVVAIPTLDTLVLDDLPITDTGLVKLTARASLRTLSVRRTQVSAAGLDQFNKARPDANLK